MNYSRRFNALLFVLIACSLVYGQQATETASQTGAATNDAVAKDKTGSDADNARLDALREKGSLALYNLDYEEARRIFTEMQREFPQDPQGPQSLAASLWLETMNNARRLQSSLYNSKAFYAKTEDKVDPKTIAAFKDYTRQAKDLAEGEPETFWLGSDGDNVY